MKTVTALELAKAYAGLHPDEGLKFDTPERVADLEHIFGNWISRYNGCPESAIATCNWCGKVTNALFAVLKLKQPRTKKKMLEVLG